LTRRPHSQTAVGLDWVGIEWTARLLTAPARVAEHEPAAWAGGAIAHTRVSDAKWQNLNPGRRLVIEWMAQL
jgi:hypothetical protein